MKNSTDVTLNISSNAICGSNDETNFPHKLLSTDRNSRYVSGYISSYFMFREVC